MPVTGTKPKGEVRRRNRPVLDWQEVDAVPYHGGPKLPKTQPGGMPWHQWTKDWWGVVSAMPHCVLWDESDWRFALETAIVAARFHSGDVKVATELRNREKVLGTTMDFRRDLRIRYVEPTIEVPAGVTAIEEYKQRLGYGDND